MFQQPFLTVFPNRLENPNRSNRPPFPRIPADPPDRSCRKRRPIHPMRRRGVREAAGRDDDGRKTEFRSEEKVQKQLKKEKDGSRGRGRKTRANASVPSQDGSVARSWNRPAHACLGQGGKRGQMNLLSGGNDVAKVRRGGGAGSRVTKCHQPRRRGNERGREKRKHTV